MPRTPPHIATLIGLTALSTVSLNMFLPSLPGIAAEFGTSYGIVSFAIAGFLAATALLKLVIGPVSDRIGRRSVMLASLAVFTLASAVCAAAPDITVFLTARIFQGAAIAGSTISLAIVRDTRDETQSASLIGYIGMAMAVAPMLGPLLGGVLDTAFGWRASFHVYTGAGLALLAVCAVDLGETRRPRQAGPGPAVRYDTLLKSRRFWGYSACMAFSTGAFYAFLAGAPLVVATTFDMSTAELGFWMGSITAGFMTGSFLSGRFAARIGPLRLIVAGRLVTCAGLAAGLAVFADGTGPALAFFASTICIGLGNGLTMPSANAGAMSIHPHLAGSAAGVSGALVVATGAVVTYGAGVLLSVNAGPQVLLALLLGLALAGLASVWLIRAPR